MKSKKAKVSHLQIVGGSTMPLDPPPVEQSDELLDPPSTFKPRERIVWSECIRNAPDGVLRKIDTGILEIYVKAKVQWERAAENVEANGTICKGPNGGVMHNPFVGVMNTQAKMMMRAISQLGFSPVTRQRVKANGKTRRSNPFGKLKSFPIGK